MSHQITISQQLVDWCRELNRYYYGDLKCVDSHDWMRDVSLLNNQIAAELRKLVFVQLDGTESGRS